MTDVNQIKNFRCGKKDLYFFISKLNLLDLTSVFFFPVTYCNVNLHIRTSTVTFNLLQLIRKKKKNSSGLPSHRQINYLFIEITSIKIKEI